MPPIHQAALQRRQRHRRLGRRHPFHPLKAHHLAASGKIRRARRRHIVGKSRKGRQPVRRPEVAERPAADHLRQLRSRHLQRQPLRQHEAQIAGQRIEHRRERFMQPQLELTIIQRPHLRQSPQQLLPHHPPLSPAPDRCHAIPRPHRGTIMEAQPGAQREPPHQPIGGHLVSRHHLRRRHAGGRQAKQHVPNHVGLAACHGIGLQRVRAARHAGRHKAQHIRARLRARRPDQRGGRRSKHGAARQQHGHHTPLTPS